MPGKIVVTMLLLVALWPRVVARAETPEHAAERFSALRLTQRAERQREGYWLLGWGAANTLVGAGLAVGFRDSPPALAASVTSAGFGLINALLALGLLDLSRTLRRAALADSRTRDPAAFSARRERALIAQLKSGQGFALNAGLDVFYLASGALLFGIGQAYGKRWGYQEGAGLAMVGQGAFLLGFDLFAWFAANRRAESLRELVR
jgi:hypothetical protein